jgi:ethanolamine utilization protein EutQ
MNKSSIRMQPFDDLLFEPRFAHGDMAQVTELCGAADGSELGAGWARMTDAHIPWTIRYDEVLTVFEGQLTLRAEGGPYVLNPRDSIWLPAGTELVYQAEHALVHYAIHPANWLEAS